MMALDVILTAGRPAQPGSSAWIAWVALASTALILLMDVAILVFIDRRSSRHDGDGPDDGGGGGGGGGGSAPTPEPLPPGAQPDWWPEFEREFAEHLEASLTRSG